MKNNKMTSKLVFDKKSNVEKKQLHNPIFKAWQDFQAILQDFDAILQDFKSVLQDFQAILQDLQVILQIFKQFYRILSQRISDTKFWVENCWKVQLATDVCNWDNGFSFSPAQSTEGGVGLKSEQSWKVHYWAHEWVLDELQVAKCPYIAQ